MTELEVKWGMGVWVTDPTLLFHTPAGRLWPLFPKKRQSLLSISLRGQAMAANSVMSRSEVPSALFRGKKGVMTHPIQVPNPFAGVRPMDFLVLFGEQVAHNLQGYTDLLTEIKRKVGPWGGTGGITVTRGYLCGPSSPFQVVVSRLDQTVKEVYRAIANGDLNLTLVMDLGINLRYTKELAYHGMSLSRYKRLMEHRNKQVLRFWSQVHRKVLEIGNTEYY